MTDTVRLIADPQSIEALTHNAFNQLAADLNFVDDQLRRQLPAMSGCLLAAKNNLQTYAFTLATMVRERYVTRRGPVAMSMRHATHVEILEYHLQCARERITPRKLILNVEARIEALSPKQFEETLSLSQRLITALFPYMPMQSHTHINLIPVLMSGIPEISDVNEQAFVARITTLDPRKVQWPGVWRHHSLNTYYFHLVFRDLNGSVRTLLFAVEDYRVRAMSIRIYDALEDCVYEGQDTYFGSEEIADQLRQLATKYGWTEEALLQLQWSDEQWTQAMDKLLVEKPTIVRLDSQYVDMEFDFFRGGYVERMRTLPGPIPHFEFYWSMWFRDNQVGPRIELTGRGTEPPKPLGEHIPTLTTQSRPAVFRHLKELRALFVEHYRKLYRPELCRPETPFAPHDDEDEVD